MPLIQEKKALSPRSRIFRALYEADAFCSRQTLARQCEISMPTLYQNLFELMEEGLVSDSGEEQSTGGRRVRGLAVVPEARFAIGVSVMKDRLRMAAADLRLRETAYRKILRDFPRESDQAALGGHLEAFLDDFHLDRSRLLGVGITVPGVLTAEGDRILLAPTLRLRDVPLEGYVRDIPYPVYVENDATCSGYAEWFARGGQENLAYLSLEDGVGGAVLIGGVSYGGNHRRGGEFGHMCVEPGGLPCACGKCGCLEAYCSARRISNDLGITLQEFFRKAEAHDPECEVLLYDLLRHLAIGINNIRLALDCDVVLGGFLSGWLIPWLPVLKRYVLAGNPFETDAEFVQFSTVRRHIAPLGAALHFVRKFIEDV